MCTACKDQDDKLTRKGLLSKPKLIAKTMYRHRPDAKVILDVGYAQQPNRDLKGTVYGVDIVTDEVPENYFQVDQVDLNTCSLPYKDETFDSVCMGCVLAHVSNPLGLLVELHRVLKKDGVIVLSSPNPNYYWETVLNMFFHYFKNRVSKSKLVEHFFEFSRYNMRTITNRAGFKVIDEEGLSFHVIKIGWSFQPLKYPGIAYEIIYTIEKDGEPEMYTICELPGENRKIPTVIN